jgi:chromosome segregation ATPase
MSLDEQFADVKSKARSIYDRVSALAGIEKGYRRQSENGVRVALEESVRAIQATFQSLASVQDPGSDDKDDLEGDEIPEKVALKQNADWLNKAFSELARQSQKGLSRTSYIKRQSIELRGDVDRLSSDISNLRSDIEGSKADTNWRIAQRRSDNAEAEASMANYQAMINDLEEELKGKKDNRALLRVVSSFDPMIARWTIDHPHRDAWRLGEPHCFFHQRPWWPAAWNWVRSKH